MPASIGFRLGIAHGRRFWCLRRARLWMLLEPFKVWPHRVEVLGELVGQLRFPPERFHFLLTYALFRRVPRAFSLSGQHRDRHDLFPRRDLDHALRFRFAIIQDGRVRIRIGL